MTGRQIKDHQPFIVDGQQIILNKEYLRGIPEFRVILERSYSIPGDANGKKKRYQWQIFMYIELIADLTSYINKAGYSESDAHKEASRASELGESFKPDEEIKAAIEFYKKFQLSCLPSLNSLRTVLRATRVSDTILQGVINNIEKRVEIYQASQLKAIEAGSINNAANDKIVLDSLLSDLKQVKAVAKDMPDVVSNIEKLEAKVRLESAGEVLGRGQRAIGNRANPKR